MNEITTQELLSRIERKISISPHDTAYTLRLASDHIKDLEGRLEDGEQEIIDIRYSVGNMTGRLPLIKRILDRIEKKLRSNHELPL